jgi:hypothetical protein
MCEDLWHSFNFEERVPSETTTIPDIVHFIWVGSKPIPSFFTDQILPMWQKYHEKIEVWTEDRI